MLKIDFDKLKHSHKYDSFGFKKTGHKVKRTLYCKTSYIETLNKNIEFKYKEVVTFCKENTNGKNAICIGYNPAKASEEIDITNKRLIDCLWDKFDGYVLVNLYPQVSSNKKDCISSLEENESFSNVIVDIIQNENDCVILFFGRTICLKEEIHKAIETRIEKLLPTKMTIHSGKFIHPGANSAIKLTEVEKENIITFFRIE